MESPELIIHIDWSGPHSYEEAASFNKATDRGIYQIYGAHHVYGSNVLLYIGKVEENARGFAGRFIEGEHYHRYCKNPDSAQMQLYFGRLFGEATPDRETWNSHIHYAERLLIHAHKPAENQELCQGVGTDEALKSVHVFNWGRYRDLLPEVSGARWSSRFNSITNVPKRSHFSTAAPLST